MISVPSPPAGLSKNGPTFNSYDRKISGIPRTNKSFQSEEKSVPISSAKASSLSVSKDQNGMESGSQVSQLDIDESDLLYEKDLKDLLTDHLLTTKFLMVFSIIVMVL